MKNISKQNAKKWRIFLSAIFGTIIALISPLFPNFINLIIKPFIGAIMVILAFDFKSYKTFFACYLLFFLITFAFGGATIAVCEMLKINYQINSTISYQNQIPIGVILLICVFIYFCFKNIIKYLFSKQKISNFQYQATIYHKDKKIQITAFLDTGNCLNYDGKPITIINYKTFCKIFPNEKFEDIMLKKNIDLPNSKYIDISSIDNLKQKILIFEIEFLVINKKKITNAILGLSLKNFSKSLQSDAIISKNILEIGETYEF